MCAKPQPRQLAQLWSLPGWLVVGCWLLVVGWLVGWLICYAVVISILVVGCCLLVGWNAMQ